MNKTRWAFLLMLSVLTIASNAQNTPSDKNNTPSMVTLSGFIKEKGSLETLPGATVYIPALNKGAVTNNYGFYSIMIPVGEYEVEFSFVGFTKSQLKLSLTGDKKVDVELVVSNVLKEVKVFGNRDNQKISATTSMSTISIPVEQIKNTPALLGEKDVFKVLQLLPGVQKAREGSSGLFVRGGTPDQNLIILDEAVVYNANHLFGFFSIFNGDALKSVELIKGGFPARFGERLSSVTVVNMKDGNKEEFHGEAGIGLLSSRFTLEGPIKKSKSSFVVSGRRTYFDIVTLPLQTEDQTSKAYFYDFNAKYNAYIDPKNRLYLSSYFGRDNFYSKYTTVHTSSVSNQSYSTTDESTFGWGNATLTARWNHIFGAKLFTNTSLIYSSFDLGSEQTQSYSSFSSGSRFNSSIQDFGVKFDVDYAIKSHTIRSGIRGVIHKFKPKGSYYINSNPSQKNEDQEQKYTSREVNFFIEDDWYVNNRLSVNAGIRTSYFGTGETSYSNFEPRLSTKWSFGKDFALKASYARMNQYIHLLSNTGIDLPTDVWVPSTARIAPQRSDQVALGIVKDLADKDITISLEGYYKKMNNILTYREGATFSTIENVDDSDTSWEDNVTAGQGKSYGVELLIQRKVGKFSGWLGYTLSWTKYQFDEINLGTEFYPKQDCRHNISIVGIYQPSPTFKISATWVYTSGTPADIGRAEFTLPGIGPNSGGTFTGVDYGTKGDYRRDAYHRLDLGAQFIKKKTRGERVWELGVYNVYSRMNPLHYATESRPGEIVLVQYSLFNIVPSITYTRRF